MAAVLSLTKRNMLVFAKNRAAVFFSMFSAFIILFLYVVFLEKMNTDGVRSIIKADGDIIAYLVNSWVMGGIIVVNSVTVTLGVLGTMVDDEAGNRLPAFLAAPVGRFELMLGYMIPAFIIGNILCVITFILSQGYIAATGGSLLGPYGTLSALGVILLSVFSSTCFLFFLVSFIRTASTYRTVSILIGSVIGLAAGIYVPVGVLPGVVKGLLKFLPLFYDASLMREIFVADPVAAVFKGMPGNFSSGWLDSMGVDITMGGHAASSMIKFLVVAGSGIAFLILSAVVTAKKKAART